MKVRILKGFRDHQPPEMLAKAEMMKTVARVFESFGYPPIQTPALEYSEVLLGKYGEEGDMLMYRFRDNGDRDVCLRYDLTVPLARFVAVHGNLPMPFRRYQIAPVWRGENPGKGRYREFYQCDVDLVGVNDVGADAEMISVGIAVLRALGVDRCQIRMNHRGVLRGLTRTLGVKDGEREAAFLRLLDKLAKIGSEKFFSSVGEEFGFDDGQLAVLNAFVKMEGSPQEIVGQMNDVVGGDPDGAAGVKRLRDLVDILDATGDLASVAIDPSIARGLSYYTGVIYETFLVDLPEFGSVMSGGRYDDLVGMFSKRELPSVGISLGLDRLLAALQELSPSPPRQSPAEVLVVRFDEGSAAVSLKFAAHLRQGGVNAVVYPSSAKMKRQFQYANGLGIPFTAVLGADEVAAGEVTLKNMDTGEQTRSSYDQAIEQIIARRGS